MQTIDPEHPFAKTCTTLGGVCTQDAAGGLSLVRVKEHTIAFYGDTQAFLATMAQKRYRRLLNKMIYLTTLGGTPVFQVDKAIVWSDHMLKFECARLGESDVMLHRFFALVVHSPKKRWAESPNAVVCGFKPTGFRYCCEGQGAEYSLEISLAYDNTFARKVYSLADMAEQFNLPVDIVHWFGEAGSDPWWGQMRDLALKRTEPIVNLELTEFDFN